MNSRACSSGSHCVARTLFSLPQHHNVIFSGRYTYNCLAIMLFVVSDVESSSFMFFMTSFILTSMVVTTQEYHVLVLDSFRTLDLLSVTLCLWSAWKNIC